MIARLTAILRTAKLPRSPERALQDALAREFDALEVTYEREVALTKGDRIDFLTANGIGIEVKVDGSNASVMRQLHRYAQCDRVRLLLLITTRRRHNNIPRAFNGKPVNICHLLGGAL